MNKFALLTISTCLFSAPGGSVLAQSSASAATDKQGQFGILQPNGFFVPLTARTPEQEAAAPNAAPINYKGTFILNLTIVVVSPIPQASKISCSASLSVFGFDSATGLQDSLYESVSGTNATRTGNTATCKFVIPYFWRLFVPTKDKVSVSFGSVSAQDAAGNYRSISVYSGPNTSQLPLPANGATTTINQVIGF